MARTDAPAQPVGTPSTLRERVPSRLTTVRTGQLTPPCAAASLKSVARTTTHEHRSFLGVCVDAGCTSAPASPLSVPVQRPDVHVRHLVDAAATSQPPLRGSPLRVRRREAVPLQYDAHFGTHLALYTEAHVAHLLPSHACWHTEKQEVPAQGGISRSPAGVATHASQKAMPRAFRTLTPRTTRCPRMCPCAQGLCRAWERLAWHA